MKLPRENVVLHAEDLTAEQECFLMEKFTRKFIFAYLQSLNLSDEDMKQLKQKIRKEI